MNPYFSNRYYTKTELKKLLTNSQIKRITPDHVINNIYFVNTDCRMVLYSKNRIIFLAGLYRLLKHLKKVNIKLLDEKAA